MTLKPPENNPTPSETPARDCSPSAKSPKASIYEKCLDQVELLNFETVRGVDGIDDEIALLRLEIQALLRRDPNNLEMILQTTNMLAKLVKTRYNMNKEQKKGLKEALANVIKDIAVPLGIAAITKKL
jgi:hypothetical protein